MLFVVFVFSLDLILDLHTIARPAIAKMKSPRATTRPGSSNELAEKMLHCRNLVQKMRSRNDHVILTADSEDYLFAAHLLSLGDDGKDFNRMKKEIEENEENYAKLGTHIPEAGLVIRGPHSYEETYYETGTVITGAKAVVAYPRKMVLVSNQQEDGEKLIRIQDNFPRPPSVISWDGKDDGDDEGVTFMDDNSGSDDSITESRDENASIVSFIRKGRNWITRTPSSEYLSCLCCVQGRDDEL